MLTARRRKTALAVLASVIALLMVTPISLVGAAPADKPARPDAPRTDRSLPDAPYVQGEVIVRFEEDAGELTKRAAHAALGSRVQRSFRLVPGLQAVRLSHGRSVEAAIRSYQAMPGVLYAQPNYIKQALSVPNDPRFSELWGLHNTGQTGGVADADIDAPEAWDLTTGSSDVVVAVVDTGIDYEHPDLAANIWTNPGEIPNNGIDDDVNGYIDDVHGWDAVNGDGNPLDDHGHGTHCAGTIGAVGNDGFGITGVNQDASVMAIKVLDAAGHGTTTDIIEGFEYLAQSPARLSSNSWGGWYVADVAERDTIAAINKLFVFAAGNDGANIDLPDGTTQKYSYPASYDLPNILAVGATTASDQRASFSNWGAVNVDVFAPGTDILSTLPAPRRKVPAADATVNRIFFDDLTTLDAWSTADYVIKPWGLDTGAYTSGPSSGAHLGYQSYEASYLDQYAAVDLSSADYPGMRFKWSYDLEPYYDFAVVWVLDESDGQWYYIGGRSGNSGGWVEQYVDLGRFAGQNDIHVAFGLWADEALDSDQGYKGVWVDDVEIFDLDSAEPGTSPWVIEIMGDWADAYATWDGTSMATPHVAGVAALALSRNEWLDYSDLKRVIMDTVDVKSQLDGLCVTEGRVNAASAVAAVVPVAYGDEFTVGEDGVLTVPAGTGVLANDSYFDQATLIAVLASDTVHGELLLDTDGSYSYTPEPNFYGTDEFTYRASDGSLLSGVATVTITVIS
ncbi:MAG: S8 family serine peptidase, partial [Coriobacteriia bacterium]